ncbi:bifunctional adenosylcobinamide kinase/adenosylcobinamide-phosphate guanylyltransferase [Aquincola tertiaricarbonis]|uniref:Bifunctional adenosylcobalamin biosynthesis protein n=1 Tax=Aquincola tertiaricarbonis TaxID=391953 RepID=A0ABY4SFG6_AQUTE|nr:bifunctional adenosylcobinamide kinase/adenosylcobinamide-phosphate guanylyltransferase [Aquincola tertiaricarbonis]URI11728.1 bifunctional adenosylcobinamide kinase/adenosylcobinamide-phosphate guanylyltransferase [Aquincola tertiaricarbonis]
MHELILGGQKSGKSRTAEARAAAWLQAGAGREATLVATALAGDEEMDRRIQRHREERAARVPGLATVEVPRALPEAVQQLAAPQRLLVVDCLTLWLTQLAMPLHGPAADEAALAAQRSALCRALAQAGGPVVLVSNEIGLGVAPMSREARRFIDALGLLHQAVAAACSRVTLMVAGCELAVKGRA